MGKKFHTKDLLKRLTPIDSAHRGVIQVENSDECYFSQDRKTMYETKTRPITSVVHLPCNENEYYNMGVLVVIPMKMNFLFKK